MLMTNSRLIQRRSLCLGADPSGAFLVDPNPWAARARLPPPIMRNISPRPSAAVNEPPE